jgi:hypothetical protein
MLPFKIVSATRADEQTFKMVALGKTLLKSYSRFPTEQRIFFSNRNGLPICYNQAIREAASPEQVIVFVHDDVHLLDFFWMDHLMLGLASFDVVGVAGNVRRLPRQPSWAFIDDKFTWDAGNNLSGMVGHGKEFPFSISVYGPTMRQCKLLDGVLLAARAKTLSNLFFDERFDFHFYDMDFCREAEQRNLKLGTVPLSLAHESVGAFGNAEWRLSYEKYLNKWGD